MRVKRLIRLMLSLLLIYWLTMCGLFVSHAYAKGWIFADFESINAKSAVKRMNSDENIVILDVRTQKEYKEKHLKNAINIPVQVLDTQFKTLMPDHDKHILVYCRSGNRSVKASRILTAHAFKPINIEGGMLQLVREDAVVTHETKGH